MWGVLCYFCFVLSYYTLVVYCDDLLLLLLSCQIHILYKTSNVILLCESLVGTAIWNSFCSLSYQTLWEMLYWIVIVKLLYTLFCPAVKLYCYVRSLLYVVMSVAYVVFYSVIQTFVVVWCWTSIHKPSYEILVYFVMFWCQYFLFL